MLKLGFRLNCNETALGVQNVDNQFSWHYAFLE